MERQNVNAARPYPPVRRRRRRRRSLWPLYAVNLLLLAVAVVQTIRLAVLQEEGLLPRAEASAWEGDSSAPVISGVRDLEVTLGDTVSYLAEVTVEDDLDPAPRLDVDTSQVDLSKEGRYFITYTAQDAAGNKAQAYASVTVTAPEAAAPATDPQVDAAVQKVLDEILTPDMTQQEQIRAIYDWAHQELRYGGHTDRSSIQAGGYEMLTTGRGDCYGYYAATRLMLDKLGITSMEVQKQRRSSQDSEHFWSLVSLDGGKTWYHFDATPRVGQTEDLCLVTDTFLDSFDTYHDGCHNRDKSLYPATPEGWQ